MNRFSRITAGAVLLAVALSGGQLFSAEKNKKEKLKLSKIMD